MWEWSTTEGWWGVRARKNGRCQGQVRTGGNVGWFGDGGKSWIQVRRKEILRGKSLLKVSVALLQFCGLLFQSNKRGPCFSQNPVRRACPVVLREVQREVVREGGGGCVRGGRVGRRRRRMK